MDRALEMDVTERLLELLAHPTTCIGDGLHFVEQREHRVPSQLEWG